MRGVACELHRDWRNDVSLLSPADKSFKRSQRFLSFNDVRNHRKKIVAKRIERQVLEAQ